MNKILVTFAMALTIATISCTAAQAGSPGGPSQAEFDALRLKVERMEQWQWKQEVQNVDHVIAHRNLANNADTYHTHDQYLERSQDLLGRQAGADANHTHDQYLERQYNGLLDRAYAEENHTHYDYADRNHTHGSSGW